MTDTYSLDLGALLLSIHDKIGEKRYNSFLREIEKHPVFIFYRHGCSHIPFGYCFGYYDCIVRKEDRPPMPEGYKLWLHLFEDCTGMDYYVFYPRKAKKGDHIKVIFHGIFLNGFVLWEHGCEGLFWSAIYELFLIESLYCSDDHVVVNLIEQEFGIK